MDSQTPQVVVAGGGIGGLTAAAALQRKGYRVRVLESAPEYRPVGAGITIQMNGMQALRQISLADDVRQAGNVLNRLVIRFANGKIVHAADMRKPAERYGVPFVAIHRARLHQVLCDAAKLENVTMGFDVAECADDGEHVRATSSDGRQESGDLLIGADGLHSQVRRHLWGKEPLRYSGYTSWRGIVDNGGLIPIDEGGESRGEKSVFGTIPLAAGKLYWFATHRTEANGRDGEDPRDTILSETGRWHDPIRAVVEKTPPADIIRTDVRDRPPRFPWGRGRITLLGDAAHPMTPNLGQGGCQAIEDAVILAELLASAEAQPEGLRGYEKRRHPRTKNIVNSSHTMSAMAHGTSLRMRFARRWLFPNIPNLMRDRLMRKIFEFDQRRGY